MRTVFFGTPDIAVPALGALCRISEVVGVVCQPDRPAGRGLHCRPPPVKRYALERGLPVFQPEKVRDGQLRSWLEQCRADVAVVLAYGRILPPDVLATPRQGCVNLHASLLPRLRGAAPIQWALLNGDQETGISLMRMDEGLDTGPVFSRHTLPISDGDDAGTLTDRLGQLAAAVVEADLEAVVAGRLTAEPQRADLATWAPPLRHEDQAIDFSWSAAKIACRVRGLSPKPGAFTTHRGRRLKLLSVRPTDEPVTANPGTVIVSKRSIWVATGEGTLEIAYLQPEGKSALAAADFVNGRGISSGESLGPASPLGK